jgi:hypothetical protein
LELHFNPILPNSEREREREREKEREREREAFVKHLENHTSQEVRFECYPGVISMFLLNFSEVEA